MSPSELRLTIVRPVLQQLDVWSQIAENLMVGTALQESLLTHTQQVGGGPALGLWQMEPATHDDCWQNFLKFRPELGKKVLHFTQHPVAAEMRVNHVYACAMARIRYYRVSAPLPTDVNDLMALAKYWKQHFNTPLGAGKPEEFYTKYVKYIG